MKTNDSPRLVVVDLPGYGFAYGKDERVEQSQQLVSTSESLTNDGSSI
jgi:GTP-binding protein EngB required for normal cell division